MNSDRLWSEKLESFAKGVADKFGVSEVDIPTQEQFAVFVSLRRCPFEARLEATVRLNRLLALMGVVKTPECPRDLLEYLDDYELLEQIPDEHFVYITQITKDGVLEGESMESDELRFSVLELENFRNEVPVKSRPKSLLVPLMGAWVKHPELRPVTPERRQKRIMPEPIRHALPSQTALPMPAGEGLASLGQQSSTTAYLPGLGPSPGSVVPVLPLRVAEISTAGPGAPIPSRLWFGCQMALSIGCRTSDNETLPLTLREISGWLWPNGWNRRRDLPRLIQGLRDLVTMGIVWERREWLLVRPLLVPTLETQLDDYLLVEVTSLPGSGRGAMIDTKPLWELGAKGAVPWRIWIRLAYLWDKAKRGNGGFRVHAERPEVRRGTSGGILDSQGRQVLKSDGRPVYDWSDPRAVRTGKQERNPQAERVPPLGMTDLALLGFDNAPVSGGTLRWRAKQTREWLTKIEELGVVVLEQAESGKLRVLEPYKETDLTKQPRSKKEVVNYQRRAG